MAIYDPSFDPYGPDRRAHRDLQLQWSAIFGGTLLGWGLLLLLSLIGSAIGLAAIQPYASPPASGLGIGSAIWAAAAMLLSSTVGVFVIVQLAGERRTRSGILEGVISWGLSMAAGTLLAVFAAGTAGPATRSLTAVPGRPAIENGTLTASRRLDEARGAAQGASAAAAAGALLALCGAFGGAAIAARRRSGRPVSLPLYWRTPKETAAKERFPTSFEEERDEPTILPPTH